MIATPAEPLAPLRASTILGMPEATAIDLEPLWALVDQKYLTVQQHPDCALLIWNYSQKCQWERHWTPLTRMCRGLITTRDGVVVARPFPKFFNLEEHAQEGMEPIPAGEPFEVHEKLDGSLGILYWAPDGPAIATRGSFTSDQAVWATRLLRERYALHPFNRALTYLFEIIYPENRIVVDYGGMRDLVLLACIETATGRDVPLLPTARRHDGVASLDALRALEERNREGYVVRFRSGMRVKVKFGEYVRLHRLVTGVTPLRVWEALRNGDSLDDYLANVPEEFARWVEETASALREAYRAIETECERDFSRRAPYATRKDAALYFATRKHPSVLFAMLDGKPHDQIIWRMVRPEGGQAFKVESDASN